MSGPERRDDINREIAAKNEELLDNSRRLLEGLRDRFGGGTSGDSGHPAP